jgi:Nif-specific regulatory protein
VEEKPRLIAISGPLQGKEFPLGDKTTIGRDPVNQISINEQFVSRQHCSLESSEEGIKITDLKSHNGTYVDDVPIKERILEHGNRIRIADSSFVFLLRDDETPPDRLIRLEKTRAPMRSTVQLRVEDALYLHPEQMLKASLSSKNVERDLCALLKLSHSITTVRNPEELQRKIINHIFEILPAERGIVLLGGEEPGRFTSQLIQYRSDDSDPEDMPVPVSQTIVERTLTERAAIVWNQDAADGDHGKVDSLLRHRVQSVLCLPLILGKTVLGVLYLDSRDPKSRFDENHLELLTAVANIAAGALDSALSLGELEAENRRLQDDFGLEHSMVGESSSMRQVYQFIAKVAPSDSTVLVYGESGTGKELAARAIHKNSSRLHKPFVKIDCTTLTENLLESELFGHEKGAFTGAVGQKKGKLELADGGTVFLDELGELPLALQSKLLRVLQDREFERVGGTRTIPIDIRLIAATNRNLSDDMKEGKFREDLYYRLNVISITLPPLRDRRDDIPLLCNYFATQYSRRVKRKVRSISKGAMDYLTRYDWPGNVRELENTIERAIVLGSTETILPEDLTENVLDVGTSATGTAETDSGNYHDSLTAAKKKLILDAVKKASGNYTEAAKRLGLHPNYLHRLIRNLDMKEDLKKIGG